jgi:hypothetical protein
MNAAKHKAVVIASFRNILKVKFARKQLNVCVCVCEHYILLMKCSWERKANTFAA